MDRQTRVKSPAPPFPFSPPPHTVYNGAMNTDARAMQPRPRKLVWIMLALAVMTLGLALRVSAPALTPAGVTHVPFWFDLPFGIGGAIGLAWAARRLWTHHRRDWRAAGFALLCTSALTAAVTLRAAAFAQADYERGRLPFFALATLILLALGSVLAFRRLDSRPSESGAKIG